RRHTRSYGDWSSDVCSSDLSQMPISILHSAKIFEVQNFLYRFGSFLSLVPFLMLSSSCQRNMSEVPPACRQTLPHLYTRSFENRSEERRVGKECRYRM